MNVAQARPTGHREWVFLSPTFPVVEVIPMGTEITIRPNVAQARRNAERQIARNPTNIVIKRTQEVDDGAGGSYRETVELPAQTVRIFMSSMQAQTVSKVGGQIQTQSWGLLGLWDADIVKGDEYQVDGRRFVVRTVSPASTGGAVTAIHADLEEVS